MFELIRVYKSYLFTEITAINWISKFPYLLGQQFLRVLHVCNGYFHVYLFFKLKE
jgi:hypothetical protein